MDLDNPIVGWVKSIFRSFIRYRNLKQIFCKHFFQKHAIGKASNQDVLKCAKCDCYKIRHNGIFIEYTCGSFDEEHYIIIGGSGNE